jgi:hypothetical protein
MSNFHNIEGYEPLFELGLYKQDSPGCRVISKEIDIDPIILAGLVVALFETATRGVPDSQQILFEQKFNQALDIMMEERFDYDVIHKFPGSDEDELDDPYI